MAAFTYSVVIPSWNGERYIIACINSLLAQTQPAAEIIVVDNGSTDHTIALIRERYPQAHLLALPQNLGFATACNRGAAASKGNILVFLNQDTEVKANWLEALGNAFASDTTGIAGCKLLYPGGKVIQHAGGYLEQQHYAGHHYGAGEEDCGQYNEPRPVEFVTGAAMAVRRSLFNEVGGFDEGFYPAYYEDTDLCLLARDAGYQVLYWPEAVAIHYESVSSGSFPRAKAFHTSRIRFALKHYPLCEIGSFWKAEHELLTPTADAGEARALSHAYITAMVSAPSLLASRNADAQLMKSVRNALSSLLTDLGAADIAYLYADEETDDVDLLNGQEKKGVKLQEFSFPSATPFIGLLRNWIYGLAGKWALRYLMQQQDRINLRHERVLLRLAGMAETNNMLVKKVAELEERLAALEGARLEK